MLNEIREDKVPDALAITRSAMYVVRARGSQGMWAESDPIEVDVSVENALRTLSGEMLSWDEAASDALVKAISDLRIMDRGPRVVRYAHQNTQDGRVLQISNRYSRLVRQLEYAIGRDPKPLFAAGASHDAWINPDSISCLFRCEADIREFDVSEQDVRRAAEALEEDGARALLDSFHAFKKMKPALAQAYNDYVERFESYVKSAERVLPGIFDRKNYCREFAKSYGTAELDYLITPGNYLITRHPEEYCRAHVLEALYKRYDASDEIVAYSHRRRGWTDFVILLEGSCDLKLVMKTNFGYGSTSYFMSTLAYKGINAINAQYIIYYYGANMTQYGASTFNYEVEESSFVTCFDEAVRIHDDYVNLGEGAFVDKYFRKSLSDLDGLLRFVAETDTFLQITSLDRLEQLTSNSEIELIPAGGVSKDDFELSGDEVNAALRASSEITQNSSDEALGRAAEKLRGALAYMRLNRRLTEMQALIKENLVRDVIREDLGKRFGRTDKAAEVAAKLIPQREGEHVKTYKGYELHEARSKKAAKVIAIISRLAEIAEVSRFDGIVESLKSTCAMIGEQDKAFLAESIEPSLARLIPQRDSLKSKLKDIESQQARGLTRENAEWLDRKAGEISEELRQVNETIAMFDNQRTELVRYIRSVNRLG